MDTREIENSLRGRLEPYIHYKGVFTSDTLPYIKFNIKPIILIANTLNSRTDVSIVGHWVGFYISFYPKKYLLFFDSYGFSPYFYSRDFSQWLEYYSKDFQIQQFGQQVQPDTSQKCGLYVVHFTHYISYFGLEKYKSFYQCNFSSRKLTSNDRIVTRYYFTRIMKKNSCSQWKKNIGNKHAVTYKKCLKYQR